MTSRAPTERPVNLRALSARSVVLSVLLGAHPPEAPVAEIVHLADAFGIQPIATRVALSRMVAAGDLDRIHTTYRLTPRLLARQENQDRLLTATVREPWDQRWRSVVILESAATDRTTLAEVLRSHRFAQLRDGVWLRPDNVDLGWTPRPGPDVEVFTTQPHSDAARLAHDLFNLGHWARTATELTDSMDRARAPMQRLTVAAAVVRHLLTDPLMPAQLLNDDWPAARLRTSYGSYQRELAELRASLRT